MARTENRNFIEISKRDGTVSKVGMTPRQEMFFNILYERLETPVPIEEILEIMDVSISNLRVTKGQVQGLVEGFYKIVSKWGRSYMMVRL